MAGQEGVEDGIWFSDRNSLKILVFNELDDDVFLRLDLKHLQRQAEERSRFDVSTVNPSNKLQLHGFVHHQLSCGQEEHTFI